MSKEYTTINEVIESLEREIQKSVSKSHTFNIESITLDLAAEITKDYDGLEYSSKINILAPSSLREARSHHRISITLKPNTSDYLNVRLSDLE